MEDRTGMKYIAIILFFLIFTFAQHSISEEIETTIVTVSNPDIRVLSSKNFTWSPRSIYVYEDERFKGFPMKETFEKAAYDRLTANSFTYVSNMDDARLVVGYALALESALSDVDLNILYGLNPGFKGVSSDKDKYEKGTIIIDIIEARTRRMVWRGALQGMAVFDLSEEERRERFTLVINRLLDEFIAKYSK